MPSKYAIVANVDIKGTVSIARRVLKYLEPKYKCTLEEHLAKKLKMPGRGTPLNKIKSEIIIAIGGDGTILRTLQHTDSKILGINAGVLGFLTEISSSELKDGFKKLIEGDYVVDNRIKLKTVLNGEVLTDATNEAVIHTAQIAKIQTYNVFVDRFKADKIRADGIIVATPTGSTCYAMSTGGPILDPKVNGFVITPIAPFKLAARPLVVPSRSTITVELVDSARPCVLVLDGQSEFEVHSGDVIKFSMSKSRAQFIRFDSDFYKRVSEKLSQTV
jgi:NAD+ kinase